MNLGWFIYSFHEFAFVLFLAVFITRPALRPILILIFIPIYLFHISGYGCPFTRIERYYHGQNVTVLDSILNILAVPITRESRTSFQAYFSSLILATMIFVVWTYPSKNK